MNYVQLYVIEGNTHSQVELFDFESIELVQQIQDVKELSTIFSDFTKSFLVPASNQNNIIFKHFYNPSIGRETRSEDNLYYDINKRKDAQLHLNHIFFKEGRLELESCEMRNGEPYAYSVTFYGKVTKFEEVFKEKTLAEIPAFDEINLTYNETQIVSLIQTAADITVGGTIIDDAIVIPIITSNGIAKYNSSNTTLADNLFPHGDVTVDGATTQLGLDILDLKPAIKVKAIIKGIENMLPGLTFQTSSTALYKNHIPKDFFQFDEGNSSSGIEGSQANPIFEELYLWMNQDKKKILEREDIKIPSRMIQKSEFTNYRGGPDSINQCGLKEVYMPSEEGIVGRNNNTCENNFDEVDKLGGFLYVPPYNDLKLTKTKIGLEVTPTNNTVYNIVVQKDGNEFYRFDNIVGFQDDSFFKIFKLAVPSGMYSFHIETLTANTFSIKLTVKKVFPSDFNIGFFLATRKVSLTASVSITTDLQIPLNKLLPSSITIMDFLGGLFKMFNLTVFVDPTVAAQNKICVRTLDNFYKDGTEINITRFVDRSEHLVETINPIKTVLFQYEGRNTILAQQHERQIDPKGWGGDRHPDDDTPFNPRKGEDFEVELPFEHMKFERLFNADNKEFVDTNTDTINDRVTTIQAGLSQDEDLNPVSGEPLLLYCIRQNSNDGLTPAQSITQIELKKTGSSQNVSTYHIPSNSRKLDDTDSATSPALALHFKPEINEYTGVAFENTLFTKFYKKYIQQSFDPHTRLFKIKARLPLDILINLKLNDIIEIFDDRYLINRMSTNFMTGITEFELVNIVPETIIVDTVREFEDVTTTNKNELIIFDDNVDASTEVSATVGATVDTTIVTVDKKTLRV